MLSTASPAIDSMRSACRSGRSGLGRRLARLVAEAHDVSQGGAQFIVNIPRDLPPLFV